MAGYRLLARIGEGGMGSVYLSHTRGGQPVALKVIRREYAQDEEFRRRFQQEVQSARRVQGYHVVPVVDHDTGGNQPWLATSYIPGLPLDDALAQYGALPLPTALQLVGCAAEALRAVHAAGVIHRDLKPSNVLLGAGGPWVIDFGIARAADSTQLTRSGGLIGTPQYMSPEHANGQQLTPATDLFSLGLIAAVAATGRHPYGEAGAITLATQIANTAIRPPDLSGYPDALRTVLERCLTADPAARPSPAELAELCERAAGRPLRDFGDWLPQPLAAEIVRREAAARRPPAPEPPGGPYGDATGVFGVAGATGVDGPGPQSGGGTGGEPGGGSAAPAGGGYGYPAGPPPGFAPEAPGAGGPSREPGGRTQKVAAIGGSVLAVVLAVTLTYAFTKSDDKGGDGAAGPGASTSAKTPGGPTTAVTTAPATTATSTAPATATGVPQLLVQDQKFIIRGPAFNSGTHVDLDKAVVDPNGQIGDTDAYEIEYQDWAGPSMRLLTTFGKSEGTTYEACRTGVGADALPGEIVKTDLDKDTYVTKGTVLCTVTSEGNLAMLRITDVTPTGNAAIDEMPTYSTLLTVWKAPAAPTP